MTLCAKFLQITDDLHWDECLSGFPVVPPGQASFWKNSRYFKQNTTLRFSSGVPGAVALQGALKRQWGVARFQIEDGPVIGPACTEELFVEFVQALKLHFNGAALLQLSSTLPYDPELEVWLRKAGFVRPPTMGQCPLTYYVDLTPDDQIEAAFTHNWRHNFTRSKKAGFQLEVCAGNDPVALKDFLSIYDETFEAKSADTHFDLEELTAMGRSSSLKIFFATQEGRRLSGRIVYFSGDRAFDFLAGTRKEGRKNYASYFLIANLLKSCSALGAKKFDFGRIGPGRYDSVQNFKKGVGGSLVQYLGEWELGSGFYLSFLFGLLRYLKRKERW